MDGTRATSLWNSGDVWKRYSASPPLSSTECQFIFTPLFQCFHFSNCLSSAFFYQFFENLLFEFEKPPLCYRLEIDISIDRGRRQGIIVCDTTLGFGKTPSF
ncbi:hypothetical protein OUZ56_018527 [Daphnia magna]|uniref:Uncharacterized protein n=1 Tax=Daphnia magna TaxID=35525 RepID=A0ABQ9Z933_9CRUS|nr:hypothetical protein OUZ56_018527 [Daphnia magna]